MTGVPTEPVAHLYVHVPFCAHKCEYCAFYSEVANAELQQRYVGAVLRELEMAAPDLQPRTIFFGGGTPSLLSLPHWKQILAGMERLNLRGAAEWTIECNPATVSADKARLWRDHGVNRLSLGVQSLHDDLLDRLGRVHSRATVFRTFDLLRRAGFDNLNLDLMFALPGQTLALWRQTLDEAIALGSEHLSTYEVTYEDDTPLFAQLQAGAAGVDEDLACEMYEVLRDRCANAGFRQYEVSNFARDGAGTEAEAPPAAGPGQPVPGGGTCQGGELPTFACQHNVNYWRGGSYHGLGPSASGYVRGVRSRNWPNTVLYCEHLERGRRAIESTEELSPLRRAGEIAAFGLRMNAGWRFAGFERVTGFDLRREWAAEMSQLVERGWGDLEADRFRLTPRGLRFADAAAELFLR